jgi:hypothetical protein
MQCRVDCDLLPLHRVHETGTMDTVVHSWDMDTVLPYFGGAVGWIGGGEATVLCTSSKGPRFWVVLD